MIDIINHTHTLADIASVLDIYRALRLKYQEDQLFLLESLSGPSDDRKQAVLGFNPLFTIEVLKNQISLLGNKHLCHALSQALKLSDLVISNEQGFVLKAPENLWEVLRYIESQFKVDYQGQDVGLRCGLFGYFSYDSVYYIENLPRHIADDTDPLPDVSLSFYQGLIYHNLVSQEALLILNDIEGVPALSKEAIASQLNQTAPFDLDKTPPAPFKVEDSIDKPAYLQWVKDALAYIAIGDIYQIQLGHSLKIESLIEPFYVYQRLRALNPSPYMYYTTINGLTIIGASPELHVRLEGDAVVIRPIAGTIKRGQNDQEDALNKQKLINDEKERAEHIMLVDLARNDIGRVCVAGSLNVTELMVIEQYSHVFHLVSHVIGKKASGFDKYDVIAASTPAGTVTGSPKVRAMELIEQFETTRRGLYAGCLGFIDFRGDFKMALCIRTATYKNGTYTLRASAGVVADSKPESEWLETIGKLSSVYLAVTGRELRHESFIN